ncbi:MAG: hypothetical protein ACXADB_06100 [Candidatus Hermodarchaeia archaeon]|jgi:hypothetical protein
MSRPPSWRKVKKIARRFLDSYDPPLKILHREGHTWYVTPHPNLWCARFWDLTIYNANKLKGIDVGGYTLPAVLQAAILEYKESAEAFGSHPEAVSSRPPSPEFKVISDRHFNARNNLARVAKESDDPRALRWYKAYVAASGNANLMTSDEITEEIVDLCEKRMAELKEAEEELLENPNF